MHTQLHHILGTGQHRPGRMGIRLSNINFVEHIHVYTDILEQLVYIRFSRYAIQGHKVGGNGRSFTELLLQAWLRCDITSAPNHKHFNDII